jgi:hypothetical protein
VMSREWVGKPGSVQPYMCLDLWMALGGDPRVFDLWMAHPKRTIADAWSELLAAVRGDLMLEDHNPPLGELLELVERRLGL